MSNAVGGTNGDSQNQSKFWEAVIGKDPKVIPRPGEDQGRPCEDNPEDIT